MDVLHAMLRGRRLKQYMDDRQAATRAEYGLNRVELEAILYFSVNPGAAAVDLHREMGMNKGQISKALEHLKREAYMIDKHDPTDRRLLHWTLLEKGRYVSELLRKQKEEMIEKLLFGVTEEERHLLEKIFGKINENIREMVK